MDEDAAAFNTLYTALVTLCEVAAPLLPLLTEEIWRGLTGGESVHLADWPSVDLAVVDTELVAAMDEVRDVVSAAHALRKTNSLRVRQPLAAMRVVSEQAAALVPFAELVGSEVNVKDVIVQIPAECGLEVNTVLNLNPRAFSPEIRKATSGLFAAQKAGAWELVDEGSAVVFPGVEVEGTPVRLEGDQFSVMTSVNAAEGQVATVLGNGTFVVLDTELTDELVAEGYARDLIRAIQDERKKVGLHISDRIALTVSVPADRVEAAHAWSDMIARETLATSVDIQPSDDLAVAIECRKI